MMNPYKIYNASAGSGKTYVLAKEYLKIVLSAHGGKTYRHILAITFTNKAVNEMKQRILGSLFEFSKITDLEKAPALFIDIQKELQIDFKTLRQRAKNTLKEILHNYSFFDVSTIDKFTHRVIRTFARDLKLSQSFEVVLDLDILLDEAVNRLLDKAGQDPQMTKVILDFALEKIDRDKSWDIAFDLNKIGKLVFDENHRSHIANLENKTITDFLELKKLLLERISGLEKDIKEAASQSIYLIQKNGLEFTDFTRSSFPLFMLKIHEGDFTIDFKASWKQNFETTPLYNQKCPVDTKNVIDGLFPQFISNFNTIKNGFYSLQLFKNAYGNIVPLTVLNAIRLELKTLEKERDLLPISAFNSIISNEIKDQPVPFIFERLGEKYRHYFIDEFQDTSEMQWNNLMPLIGNALDTIDENGKTGSLLLVGDPKQAIYRWRGGQAEQFLNLINFEKNPFVTAPQIHLLPKNYRSHEEIIKFNNAFFTALSPFLNNGSYSELFINGNKQEFNSLKGGSVKLNFIDENDDDDKLYFKNVLEIINEILEKNYALKDICILTRKKEHGIILASELMQINIPVVSSETLLLGSNPQVNFLINLLRYSLDPENWSIAYEILLFLTADSAQQHKLISDNLYQLTHFLKKEYLFNLDYLRQSSVFDGLECAIRQFNLVQNTTAYITFLLDAVLDVEEKEGTNISIFLDYWEKKKGTLSVVAPENVDAINIMTIHKSKGLEFPFVVFPYANTLIYPRQESKLWLPVAKEHFNDFDELLINKKNEVPNYSETAEHVFYEEHEKQELDAFNLLYVAMTRAVKALYVITQKKSNKENAYATDNYAGLFIHFLKLKGLWNENQTTYTFGNLEYNFSNTIQIKQYHIPFQTTNKERPAFKILAKSGSLWETDRQEALNQGNLIHHLLSLIDTSQDLHKAFELLIRNGDIESKEIDDLKTKVIQVIAHPELKSYFESGSTVKREKDIITENGLILRPDRVVIHSNELTLIDFKTGKKDIRYHQQLQTYADALKAMGYTIKNRILVYINEKVTPEFI